MLFIPRLEYIDTIIIIVDIAIASASSSLSSLSLSSISSSLSSSSSRDNRRRPLKKPLLIDKPNIPINLILASSKKYTKYKLTIDNTKFFTRKVKNSVAILSK